MSRCLSRSREVTRWLLKQAIRFLPADQRDRYYLEWLANIEQLEQEGLPTLGEGIQILHAGARIGSRRRAQLAGARTKQRARRLGPGWVGVLTGMGSFFIALSALLLADAAAPGMAQIGLAAIGSLILGIVAGNQARPARPDDS